jgi:hypothetical protein
VQQLALPWEEVGEEGAAHPWPHLQEGVGEEEGHPWPQVGVGEAEGEASYSLKETGVKSFKCDNSWRIDFGRCRWILSF